MRTARWIAVVVLGMLVAVAAEARAAELHDLTPTDDAEVATARQRLERWHHTYPESPTPIVALGALVMATAWRSRGGKYARETPQQNWNVFRERTREARQILETNRTVGSRDPGWYNDMLDVGLAEGWSKQQYGALFNEAVAKEPAYYDLYFSAVQRLLPRWGGSMADIRALADRAVDRTRSIEGSTMYARIYWMVTQWNGTEGLHDGTIPWSKMKAGFVDLLKHYPSGGRDRQAFAHFGCVVGDREPAAELMKQFGDDWYSDVWGSKDLFRRCQRWANGH